MIDIHSHLKTDSGEGSVQKLLQDMDRFHINRRVISDMRYDDVQDGNQKIAELVKEYPERLIGCAVLNPALSTILEDTRHACSLKEIRIFMAMLPMIVLFWMMCSQCCRSAVCQLRYFPVLAQRPCRISGNRIQEDIRKYRLSICIWDALITGTAAWIL